MRNRLLFISALSVMLSISQVSVFAFNYQFDNVYEDTTFGKATTSDKAPDYSAIENVRRDKNSAYYPPNYGVFSGEIPTELTSKYHEQDRNAAKVISYNNVMTYGEDTSGGFLAPTSNLEASTGTDYLEYGESSDIPNVQISYTEPEPVLTSVTKNSDGSIGNLRIPKLGLNAKIYENTDLETMKIGIGHFSFTSQWSGNIGLASHNRGNASYFNGIWDLENGDEVTYETSLGTRTYVVFNKVKVNENDFSMLTATNENILTMITCVANQSELRWCVQAKEKI